MVYYWVGHILTFSGCLSDLQFSPNVSGVWGLVRRPKGGGFEEDYGDLAAMEFGQGLCPCQNPRQLPCFRLKLMRRQHVVNVASNAHVDPCCLYQVSAMYIFSWWCFVCPYQSLISKFQTMSSQESNRYQKIEHGHRVQQFARWSMENC